jgi:DNA invertase Pin-like site-specific DNA recombinase
MKAIVAYCRSACEPHGGSSKVRAQLSALHDAEPETSQVYMDAGVSGLTLERPALQRLIADCRAGKIATVIVQDHERLSRDRGQLVTLLHMFQEAGVRVEFATGSDPRLDPNLSASGFAEGRYGRSGSSGLSPYGARLP